jgi:hypothetical protein
MTKPALTWSQPTHRGSSDVHYVAEDPSPSLKHGAYHIRRGEGGITLTYERWRDEHGGSVPIQHVSLGQYRSLAAAKSAAARHHRGIGGADFPLELRQRLIARSRSRSQDLAAAARSSEKTPAQLEREIRAAMAAQRDPAPRGISPHQFRKAKYNLYDAQDRLIGDFFADSAEEAARLGGAHHARLPGAGGR